MPQDPAEIQYAEERSKTYDRIIAAIDRHVNSIAPRLIVDIHTMAPTAVREGAEREAWSLFGKGLRHLKEGAPGGKPGLFTEALSKTSLRNAAIANGFNVKPPKYEAGYTNYEFDTGAAEAVFYARRLIEAAEEDLPKSTKAVQDKIATSDAESAFGLQDDDGGLSDPELSAIFEAVKKGAGAKGELPEKDPLAKKGPSAGDVAAMRRQSMMALTFLKDAYAETGVALKKEIDAIVADYLQGPEEASPKKKRPPPQSFDL
ncbi:MAG: hypothetical protein GC185_07165 [Alphaproteobacteria bacterium]|nr:hypothetical protein [Alphaproteobacteria bacterium]